jgi:uncharacterized protein with von Willebrand factor type A (vWA) domain
MAPDRAPLAHAADQSASYEVRVNADARKQIARFWQAKPARLKRQQKGMRQVDIRPLVHEIVQAEGGPILVMLAHSAEQSLNPELLLSAMDIEPPYRIVRTGLYATRDNNIIKLLDGDFIQ